MASLLETYSKRLQVSESVFSKAHEGATLDNHRKMAVAMVLNNTNRFMNEAFASSVGTQRADLGEFKKFTLNLTTVALPNLIAMDLVIVQPMASISGFITYVKYTSGTTKGETTAGDVFNEPFKLGAVDANWTSSAVVEAVTVTGSEGVEVTLAWTPVVANAFGAGQTVKFIPADGGAISYLTVTDGKVLVPETGKIAYMYNNEIIPQTAIPTVNAKIESIALVAKARRVAVYYSQIAAFQAKTDYGFDLGDQLAEKAVGQLAYEIDTEITNLLISLATVEADLTFNRTVPTGVSKAEHFEGFIETLEIGRQLIYDRTKRFAPNYMLIASNILPILSFIKGFKASPAGKINGPYLAGTVNGMKVFVTPNIAPGKFVLGVNGDDMMSSAAVYAPYMAVVPTQLLGYADGGMNQGFSTLYALEPLNVDLVVSGEVVALPQVVLAQLAD
jgi:hypothetical protein